MQGLIIEKRKLADSKPLSRDLAYQILSRCEYGRIAVVTDHPLALLGAVRKEWLKIIRQLQRQWASTLDLQRKNELNQITQRMRSIDFTAQNPANDPIAYVSLATPEQFRLFPPMCRTLFIVSRTEKIDQYVLTSWMPRNGVVVIYV